MERCSCVLAVLASLVFTAPLHAADPSAPGPNERMLLDDNFGGFLETQPDLRLYRLGLEAHRDGDPEQAFRYFRQAARYADKPSQALVAQMYWDGIGVARDRALAYAWMDLAAERGDPRLLAMREQYWTGLDEAGRADALARGEQVYAEYGDAVAQPRIEAVLRRKKNRVAGSRTGYTGNATVLALPPGAPASADSVVPVASMAAASFYHPVYWQPEQRYAWRAGQWEREIDASVPGTTRVGDLQPVRGDKAE